MTFQEVLNATNDRSIYGFNREQLTECLKAVATAEIGGNPGHHANLLKTSNLVNFLLSDLDSKEQLKWNKRIAFTAIGISVVSLAVAVCSYLASSKWNENALGQLKSEISAVHLQEQKTFQLLSSSRVRPIPYKKARQGKKT